jgi:hypothetical protein
MNGKETAPTLKLDNCYNSYGLFVIQVWPMTERSFVVMRGNTKEQIVL